MKDSRIGTYGTVALFGALALKLALLVEVEPVWAVLLVAPALARLAPLFLMALMPYVTDTDASKTKPVADTFSGSGLGATLFSVLLAGVGSWWLPELMTAFVVATAIVGVLWGMQLQRTLGGYTGDALGASVVLRNWPCLPRWSLYKRCNWYILFGQASWASWLSIHSFSGDGTSFGQSRP